MEESTERKKADVNRKKRRETSSPVEEPTERRGSKRKKQRQQTASATGTEQQSLPQPSLRGDEALAEDDGGSFPPPDFVGVLEHILHTGSVTRAACLRYHAFQSKLYSHERSEKAATTERDLESNSQGKKHLGGGIKEGDNSVNSTNTGVWPSVALENSTGKNSSTCSDEATSFAASLDSDDRWEVEYGDGLKTNNEGATAAAAATSTNAVLESLIDRSWHRAVHMACSLNPYNYSEEVQEDNSPGDRRDFMREDSDVRGEEVVTYQNTDGTRDEQDCSVVNSVLEREAMFVIDSLLHIVMVGGSKSIEKKKKNRTTETGEVAQGPLNWMDVIKILNASTAKTADAASAPGSVLSPASFTESFAQTIQAHPGIPPIPLNQETMRSILMRLSEIYDPTLV
mmetsp:Transcript_34984/g.76526  ORF Transcript_34984/g.76526 Transcript_34984/m.76526 type:complete len:399 (-) Transcript_34984:143-1339(-)